MFISWGGGGGVGGGGEGSNFGSYVATHKKISLRNLGGATKKYYSIISFLL